MKILKYISVCFFLLTSPILANPSHEMASAHEYYSLANKAFYKYEWIEVIKYSKIIIQKYPTSSFTKDALFYLGVAYFNLKDYEIANKYFTRYLKDDFNPKYFEECMHYKFSIAQFFKKGAKKRMFGWKKGPKVVNANEDSLAIFDEIIASMPTHDLAVLSLFAKGEILFEDNEFKDSISAFEQIIDRFETHELALDSFIKIQKIYLKQTTYKKQDPNILELAELNLEKFKEKYPFDTEKAKIIEDILIEMREKFAIGFLEIAEFYEKTNKKGAAKIYYSKIINSFPNTKSSKVAKERLDYLDR
jgi:outer membrane protein assembly factor BamD